MGPGAAAVFAGEGPGPHRKTAGAGPASPGSGAEEDTTGRPSSPEGNLSAQAASLKGPSNRQRREYAMKSVIGAIIKGWIVFWSVVFFLGVLVNFCEIILRLFFNFSLDLFYDIPVWCTVWATLLVSGPLLLDGEHVSIDALESLLKGKVKKAFSILNALIVLVFGMVFTYGGVLFVSELYRFGTAYTRSVSIPSWMIETCVPLGLFIFTCCAFYDLYRKIMKKNT